ncbi:hypothetical protein JEZ13_04145 [bacterium]|nr:hypothetical protein [bacterium]MBI9072949.1 hypothetical protein [Melioribacteraceae bacterium]
MKLKDKLEVLEVILPAWIVGIGIAYLLVVEDLFVFVWDAPFSTEYWVLISLALVPYLSINLNKLHKNWRQL